MPARVLIIEDHPDLTELLRYELQDAGYEVVAADDGLTGLRRAREEHPDLVLLDLGLPHMDGAEVTLRLRKISAVPIIVLTAIDAVESKVKLLDSGANDYLTKPFHLDELLARVEVQLRHEQWNGEDLISIGDLELHLPLRLCLYAGREVHLSPKEFELLLFLARHPGRVYSREDLEREVWHGALPPGSNTLHVHVGNLRHKLRGVDADRLIRTLRGVGYAFRSS